MGALDDDEVLSLLNGPPRRQDDDVASERSSLGLRVGEDGRLVDRFLDEHDRYKDDRYVVEDARPKRKQLEAKNDELKLRVAGLTRSIRELTDTNSRLRVQLDDRDAEVARLKSRVAALSQVQRPPVSPEPRVRDTRDDRRRLDSLSTELVEARRRERRAVELGSALRRRAHDERDRAERAEDRAAALERSARDLRTDVDRTKDQRKKDQRAAVHAKQALAHAEARCDELRDHLKQAKADLDEHRSRFAARRKELDTARAHDRANSLETERQLQDARDECLALRTRLATFVARREPASVSSSTARCPPREKPARPAPPLPEPASKEPPPLVRDFWADDDDDEDDDGEWGNRSPSTTKSVSRRQREVEVPRRSAPAPEKQQPARKSDPAAARFERLQARFNRVVHSHRSRSTPALS